MNLKSAKIDAAKTEKCSSLVAWLIRQYVTSFRFDVNDPFSLTMSFETIMQCVMRPIMSYEYDCPFNNN